MECIILSGCIAFLTTTNSAREASNNKIKHEKHLGAISCQISNIEKQSVIHVLQRGDF